MTPSSIEVPIDQTTNQVRATVPVSQIPNLDVDEADRGQSDWTDAEIAVLRSLWIGSLPLPPGDPSNRVADDPRAAALGRQLFFDARFSADGTISCATCHQPTLAFTDGLPQSIGVKTGQMNAMSLLGVAHSPWFFWDGHKDSLWAQALEPWESPFEHGGTRTQYVRILSQDSAYRQAYEALFGPLPDFSDEARFPINAAPIDDPLAAAAWTTMAPDDQEAVTTVFVNMGKAVAAFERHILPSPSPFDAYVEALLTSDEAAQSTILPPDAIAGLRLFIGPGLCIRCHNGPLFSNNDFHNTAVTVQPEGGRFAAVQSLKADLFNCLGAYSDADPSDCAELNFMKTGRITLGAFRTPSLRNVAETAPYMHAGQLKNLSAVLQHYNQAGAVARPPSFGHNELDVALNLSEHELAQIEAFLHTLSGPVVVPDFE
ncbi:MAG: cytochrome c peroxidase [Chloroflexota bacterium]